MSPVESIGGGEVLGPPIFSGRRAVIGVTSGGSFSGACSLIINGAGRRLRIELTAEEGLALAEVVDPDHPRKAWSSSGSKTVSVTQADGAVIITVESFSVRISDAGHRVGLFVALHHHAIGSRVAVGAGPVCPDGFQIAITAPEADRLGVHPGLYQAIVVDRRAKGDALVVDFNVVGDAGSVVGQVSRHFRRGGL